MSAPVYTDDMVTSCDSCPFSVLRLEGRGTKPYWCTHPKWPEEGWRKMSVTDNPFNEVPAWCPLREGTVLVKLSDGVK